VVFFCPDFSCRINTESLASFVAGGVVLDRNSGWKSMNLVFAYFSLK